MNKITIKCPVLIQNKVSVIKAIRTLTNFSLKEAKDASERTYLQTLDVIPNISDFTIKDQVSILRENNVQVGEPIETIINRLRELGADALTLGEDELANQILQLVLAEKLRRVPSTFISSTD